MTRHECITAAVLLAAATFSATACAESHRGAPIQGRVVDAATKQAVADVVVVAEWRLEGGLHTDVIGRLHLQETVTDSQGVYRFPAWGPIKVEKGRLDPSSPVIHFYKRGYRFQTQRNEDLLKRTRTADALVSDWNGKTIELVSHGSGMTSRGYFQETGEAPYLYSVDDKKCAWQLIPRMTAELMKRGLEYADRNVMTSLPTREGLYWEGRCSDPNAVLREYLE